MAQGVYETPSSGYEYMERNSNWCILLHEFQSFKERCESKEDVRNFLARCRTTLTFM